MYEWVLNSEQIEDVFAGLPREAVTALVAFMDAVVFDPWEFARRPGELVDRRNHMRQLAFGSAGTVSFVIQDDEREVVVVQILWAG